MSEAEREATGDFDAGWYARRYPDVALSGLAPRQHYDRVGRILGRAPAPGVAPGTPDMAGPDIEAELPDIAAAFGTATRRAALPRLPARPDDPLVPRPEGLRLGLESLPRADPVYADGPLGAVDCATPGDLAAFLAPLEAYRALLDPAHAGLAALAPLMWGAALREGRHAVADMWIEGPGRMCVRVGNETSDGSDGGLLSAWQEKPTGGNRLRRVGHAALPRSGPLWWDIDLDNPFMPILLCLARTDGTTRAVALIPFPSLARGGAHAAELALHRANGDGLAALRRLGERFATELERQTPAVGAIEVAPVTATGPANGSEAIFDPDMIGWMDRVFGLRPGVAPQPVTAAGADPMAGDEGREWLAADYPMQRRPGPRTLRLPADQVPTISALLATEAALGPEREIAGSFLVVDAQTARARWSVSVPARPMPWLTALQPLPWAAACPVLTGGPGRADGDPAAALSAAAPFPLGIARRRLQPLSAPRALFPVAPDAPGPVLPAAPPPPDAPFTVVLQVEDAARAVLLLEAVQDAAGRRDLQILVLPRTRAAADAFVVAARMRLDADLETLTADATLATAADRARHDEMLVIDDRIVPSDPRAIGVLRAILAADPGIGAASCTLLRETMTGKTHELSASGGLFPSRISLLALPALIVEEPDVAEALPMATYPVIGGALDFAMLRRAAVVAARDAIAAAPADQADIAFALAATGAGYVHLVTSAVALGTSAEPRARRSDMDPVGRDALRLHALDRLLASVTVLAELR